MKPSRDTEKEAALQAACGGHTEILKYFVEERKISSYEEKCNCVVNAAMYGKLDCIKYLLGEEAKTPLNFWQYIAYARYYEHPRLRKLLARKRLPRTNRRTIRCVHRSGKRRGVGANALRFERERIMRTQRKIQQQKERERETF